MKTVFKKNQIIITTLAAMIAIAGYLNYSGEILKDKVETASTSEDTLLVMDAAPIESVGDELTASADYSVDNYTDIVSMDEELEDVAVTDPGSVGESVLASSGGTDAIYASAKLSREQARSKNKESLMEIINNAELADNQKQDAVETMSDMALIAEKESAAETLLQAKGYDNCVVSISGDQADVVVAAASLDEAQRAQIEDIVKRKTDVPGERIVITPQLAETSLEK